MNRVILTLLSLAVPGEVKVPAGCERLEYIRRGDHCGSFGAVGPNQVSFALTIVWEIYKKYCHEKELNSHTSHIIVTYTTHLVIR